MHTHARMHAHTRTQAHTSICKYVHTHAHTCSTRVLQNHDKRDHCQEAIIESARTHAHVQHE